MKEPFVSLSNASSLTGQGRGCALIGALLIGAITASGAAGCGSNEPGPAVAGTGGISGSGGTTPPAGSGGAGDSASGGSNGSGGGDSGSGGAGPPDPIDAGAADAGPPEAGSLPPDPGKEGDGTFMIGPQFTTAPEVSDKANVAKGQIIRFTLGNSKSFADGTRNVAVYVPAKYTSDSEIPFMVAQDGVNPQNGGSFGLDDLRPIMDNMIADGRLPMMAGIFVDPAGQRSVEYDTPSDKYFHFVEDELLPEAIARVKASANVTLNLTKDPEGRGTFGGSSGGSAAFTMGWFHPEGYRRILTLSGSFVNLKTADMFPNGCADYHMSVIAAAPVKPLRVFLEAGTNDNAGRGGWKNANDAMAKALGDKGYHYRYIVAQGASHEDNRARRQYLPEAMAWLWRGYKKP